MKKKLIRERDNLTKVGEIDFVEWNEDGSFKEIHKEPKIGYSIIVDSKNGIFYTWLTSIITDILEDGRIKTNNSVYKIEDFEEK